MAALAVVAVVAVILVGEPSAPAGAQTTEVTATVETDPVPSSGDAADDPAIWVHPTDPSLSTIIGTDKEGGLVVYDLSGSQLQYISGIRPNNVDIRHGVPLGGQLIDLVVASERDDDVIVVYRVDPQTRQLVAVGAPVSTGMDIYGICLYHSPVTDGYYVFVTSEEAGPVGQFELTDNGSGGITGRLVRDFVMTTTAEGSVADDDLGYLYVAEEDVGVWKYGAEPDSGSDRVSVDALGPNLEDDIEGMTIYYGPGETGYLIVSSQGSDEYVVYQREGDNEHVHSFEILDSAGIDGATNTDGIDVISAPLGPAFPMGLFVAQDGENDPENQNFKLVPWELVAGSANPSLIEAGRDPRGGSTGTGPPGTVPPVAPDDGVTWTVAEAAVVSAEDDGELAADGSVTTGSTLVMQAGNEVLLRFADLEVPPGAVLRSAHVQFTAADAADTDVVLSVSGILEGSQDETMVVTWAPAPWEAEDAGLHQRTPDLSRAIEEVMASGWEPGSVLTLLVAADGDGQRSALAFDEAPEAAPRLMLQYTLDY